MNSLFTVHAVDYTASTGAQEAAQSTRATHLGAQDRSRDLTGATNGDVSNPNGFQPIKGPRQVLRVVVFVAALLELRRGSKAPRTEVLCISNGF